ncbi:MAG: hypothetical protein JO053_09540, partial [Acidobacteria bacterium]|nr:hypothetical protein [Acidobacteriota bacterium]
PRVDAIDEVTVSTANPGADASGDGAVQIKFVTKRGTNDYRGGAFYQHRDESLNANYWYNNRDGALDSDGKAFRQKIRLNQFGAHMGGPIPFFAFGEGVKPFDNGKDKRFFFVNYEEYRIPQSQARTRFVLTPNAQAGLYTYVGSSSNGAAPSVIPGAGAGEGCTKAALTDTSQTCVVNVYRIAGIAGMIGTIDPTISGILSAINSATSSAGAFTPNGDVNLRNWNYNFQSNDLRKFLALRFDANINKKNSIEAVINRQHFVPTGYDFLNSVEQRFPSDFFKGYSQGSTRNAYSWAVRSTITNSMVNEARLAQGSGVSAFRPGISAADFANQNGFTLGGTFGPAFSSGNTATGATASATYSSRSTPTWDWTDNLNWIHGNHSFGFGGEFKRIKSTAGSQTVVPSVGFGIDSTEGTAFTVFGTTNMPGSTTSQQGIARGLYAALAGHVLSFSNTALLMGDGTYQTNQNQDKTIRQDLLGLYAQDSWKIRPNFTINYGVRWQPQKSPVVLTGNYSRMENYNEIFSISGPGGMYQPGASGGTLGKVVAMAIGEKTYADDWNNFAPTVGAVWSPNFKGGVGKFLFGGEGKTVFRGGYSWAFVREGLNLIDSIIGSNPGGSLVASRSLTLGNMTTGTLFRTAGNPMLTNQSGIVGTTPAYPYTLVTAVTAPGQATGSANVFDPNLHTGRVESYSVGIQREIDKNSVVEIRYVGNRGKDLTRQYDINDFNTIENGFAAEYLLAQQNLYANMAAGRCISGVLSATNRCDQNFAYFGPGTGTSPLPIMTSYFVNSGGLAANNAAALIAAGGVGSPYTATNFANTTLVASLNNRAPSLSTWSGSSFESNNTRRLNALANGRPDNFFYVNPQVKNSGAYTVNNSAHSWYDSLQIEFRRRLAQGLRVQTSYVWGKALSDAVASSSVAFSNVSSRSTAKNLAKNYAVFDIRHALKFDATYDLPFGRGRQFFSNMNRVMDSIFGGWSVLPSFRLQSGSPIQIGNVQLVGMTVKELQKAVKLDKNVLDNGAKGNPNAAQASIFQVAWLPIDIIQNSRAAFNLDLNNCPAFVNGNTGNCYSSTFGAPTGRYIAPAGTGNCVNRFVNPDGGISECGFNNLIIYGPRYFKFDVTVLKRIKITETANIELAATALDALNKPNWRVGGWGADAVGGSCCSSTAFGFLGSGTAYQDVSTTNDNGGRQIDLRIRINW